jgi:flavin reductase (DIM6/NTAB) family NADH-FMN oxidoreductase RutF
MAGVHAYPLQKVYRLLEPGPVVMVTTSWKGVDNVMTMSWQTMIEFTPPLVACVVSDPNHSFKALDATGECVLAIPPVELAREVVKVGSVSGWRKDKFKAYGLTRFASEEVAPPCIAECYANLECRVADRTLVKKYNLFILEVVKAWIDPSQPEPLTFHHQGHGKFQRRADWPYASLTPALRCAA